MCPTIFINTSSLKMLFDCILFLGVGRCEACGEKKVAQTI